MDILMQMLPGEAPLGGGQPTPAPVEPVQAPDQGQAAGEAGVQEAVQSLSVFAQGLTERGDPRGEAMLQMIQQMAEIMTGGGQPAPPQLGSAQEGQRPAQAAQGAVQTI